MKNRIKGKYVVEDVFCVGEYISVTLQGDSELLQKGCALTDNKNNEYCILSVAMQEYCVPKSIKNITTVLMRPCKIEKGDVLCIDFLNHA